MADEVVPGIGFSISLETADVETYSSDAFEVPSFNSCCILGTEVRMGSWSISSTGSKYE